MENNKTSLLSNYNSELHIAVDLPPTNVRTNALSLPIFHPVNTDMKSSLKNFDITLSSFFNSFLPGS